MEKREKQEKMPVSARLKACRVIGILMMVAAIAYLVWPDDYDNKGVVGYVDDCFLFMVAYTFTKGSFMRPERRYIRRQLYTLSSLFALLALCWTILMIFTK